MCNGILCCLQVQPVAELSELSRRGGSDGRQVELAAANIRGGTLRRSGSLRFHQNMVSILFSVLIPRWDRFAKSPGTFLSSHVTKESAHRFSRLFDLIKKKKKNGIAIYLNNGQICLNYGKVLYQSSFLWDTEGLIKRQIERRRILWIIKVLLFNWTLNYKMNIDEIPNRSWFIIRS